MSAERGKTRTRCTSCKGTGEIRTRVKADCPEHSGPNCQVCQGSDKVEVVSVALCTDCDGSGWRYI